MTDTPLRRAWRENRAAIGLWSALDGTLAPEILASTGADYVCLDLQHGAADVATAMVSLQAIAAAGATPAVRVGANDPLQIGKALDLGALAVIVPMVNDADDARRAAAACAFEPDGQRSYGPLRAGPVIGSGVPADLRAGVACLAMVETREAVENVEAIAATPGIDGIYVGQWDLAISLGLEPTLPPFGDAHVEALAIVRAACERHGIIAGVHCIRGEDAARALGDGFQMVTVAGDWLLLRAAAVQELDAARRD